MRTTLTLHDEIYEQARKIAFDEHRALGDVVSELAARGLEANRRERVPRKLGFWTGEGFIADDFNATPQEVLDALDTAL
jgi:hypothetical protein